MSADVTMTIALDGNVPLEEFARTIGKFNELVKALSEEVGAPTLDWIIDDLQISSAIATIRAENATEKAQEVVAAYAEIGDALAFGRPVKYSAIIKQAAQNIVNIKDARIKSVRFETPSREATIETSPGRIIEFPAVPEDGKEPAKPNNHTSSTAALFDEALIYSIAGKSSYGGIHGRVQSLNNRGNLRFTIYDLFYDKAINCYMAEHNKELLRDIWGKMAVVEGMITRDFKTGRPLAIRQVKNITPQPEPSLTTQYLAPETRFLLSFC